MNIVKNKITHTNTVNVNILNLTNDYLTASLIGYIYYYHIQSTRKYCFATDDILSNYFKVSPSTISKLISKLKKSNLITSNNTQWQGIKERRTVLTERCLEIYKLKKEESIEILNDIMNKKITKDNMENLDDSIFSDKPIEQKPLKGKSLIIPGDSNIGKDEEDFNKLRANYFQPKIYNKKKELKAYLELTPKDRITAYQNLKDYLELNKDNQQYIVSLQNYLLDRKFSDENIEYLKKVKKKPNKESDNAPIKDNQWDDFK